MLQLKQLLLLGFIVFNLAILIWLITQPSPQYPLNKIWEQELLGNESGLLLYTKKVFDLNIHYILNNENLCGNETQNILALIIVTSYSGNVETRNSMREAVSNEELRRQKFRRLFLLAEAPTDQYVQQNLIINESLRFQDILQGNFQEAYRNLTYKHMMGIKWVCQFCPHAKFVIKMDDDIVVDLSKLSDLLNLFSSMSDIKFVSGYVLKNMKPIRKPGNKWFVTPQEYRPNFYPTFLSGWFYITNPQSLRQIVEYADKYFWIDDILITGILVQMARVKRIDISRYFTPHSEFLECCITDFEKRINCEFMVGPNGGDANLFYKFNKKSKICIDQSCRKRKLPLNETCVAKHKDNLGRGKAFISNFKL